MGLDLTAQEEETTTTLCKNREVELFSYSNVTNRTSFSLWYEVTQDMLCIQMTASTALCLETVNQAHSVLEVHSYLRAQTDIALPLDVTDRQKETKIGERIQE